MSISAARYEIKYQVPAHRIPTLHQWMLRSQAFFKREHKDRYVNNIYFDTPTWQDAADNLVGLSERAKYRVRWYGNPRDYSEDSASLVKMVLEEKIKKNKLGIKRSYQLGEFDLSQMSVDVLVQKIADCDFHLSDPSEPGTMNMPKNSEAYFSWRKRAINPVTRNQYKRAYYLDRTGLVRMTIDSEQQHGLVYKNAAIDPIKLPMRESQIIVEFKAVEENFERLKQVVQKFPFRPTRNSKYLKAASQIAQVPYF